VWATLVFFRISGIRLFSGTEMQLKVVLATQTKVTAQMVLTTRLLGLSGTEVDEAVKQELAENPALEAEESHPRGLIASNPPVLHSMYQGAGGRMARLGWAGDPDGNYADPIENLTAHESPIDWLLAQARLLVPAEELEAVSYLIQSLDERGFLRATDAELGRELGATQEQLGQTITWLQRLDPPGIGACDLRECFLLQCADLEARGIDCRTVVCILEEAWDPFVHRSWDTISRCTGISRREIDAALRFIRNNLYPYPLLLVPGTKEDTVLARPDLIVRHSSEDFSGRYQVEIPAAQAYELRISPVFRMALNAEAGATLDPDGREWICQAIERARLFIAALDHRWGTLQRIGEFLIHYQSDFFERGPRYLRPLTRAEVARQLGLHESTISRAVRAKIVQLPDGRLMELRDLFDRSLAAREAIRQLIAGADRPLSDREIAESLEKESFHLARRTVAKYRAQMQLPAMGRPRKMSKSSRDEV
jgi:RNA polymerase sigma-54 factor